VWRGLVTLGALTYPVYLLHHRIGLAVIGRLHDQVNPWVLLAATAAGVPLLSYAVHRLVERPLSGALRGGLRASFARIRAADPAAPSA
jgi:peptidoglycan/LPS O-acetylase OafA/YrhL